MKTHVIEPRELSGHLQVQPSKYLAHRYILAAALAKGRSEIFPMLKNDDVIATIGAAESLGIAKFEWEGNKLLVFGGQEGHDSTILCNESGSTLRFIIPIVAALGLKGEFRGKGRLLERPMGPYKDIFTRQKLKYSHESECIRVEGQLSATHYELPGDISSQFITGLLFALPILPEASTIGLTSVLESKGYVDMTLGVIKKFGVSAHWKSDFELFIPGGQSYAPSIINVDGDWAHAAFFLVAGALGGGNIKLTGLSKHKTQDSEIMAILTRMGANIGWEEDTLCVKGGELKGIEIDGGDIPDLIPILAVAASLAKGPSVFRRLARLRYKESNRLDGLADQLRSIGAKALVVGDDLHITGGHLRGGGASSLGDHRIAMSLAVAGTCCEGTLTLRGAESVAKSAPNFWREFASLGGRYRG